MAAAWAWRREPGDVQSAFRSHPFLRGKREEPVKGPQVERVVFVGSRPSSIAALEMKTSKMRTFRHGGQGASRSGKRRGAHASSNVVQAWALRPSTISRLRRQGVAITYAPAIACRESEGFKQQAGEVDVSRVFEVLHRFSGRCPELISTASAVVAGVERSARPRRGRTSSDRYRRHGTGASRSRCA